MTFRNSPLGDSPLSNFVAIAWCLLITPTIAWTAAASRFAFIDRSSSAIACVSPVSSPWRHAYSQLRVQLAAQPELVTPVLRVVQRIVIRHLMTTAWQGPGTW